MRRVREWFHLLFWFFKPEEEVSESVCEPHACGQSCAFGLNREKCQLCDINDKGWLTNLLCGETSRQLLFRLRLVEAEGRLVFHTVMELWPPRSEWRTVIKQQDIETEGGGPEIHPEEAGGWDPDDYSSGGCGMDFGYPDTPPSKDDDGLPF